MAFPFGIFTLLFHMAFQMAFYVASRVCTVSLQHVQISCDVNCFNCSLCIYSRAIPVRYGPCTDLTSEFARAGPVDSLVFARVWSSPRSSNRRFNTVSCQFGFVASWGTHYRGGISSSSNTPIACLFVCAALFEVLIILLRPEPESHRASVPSSCIRGVNPCTVVT